MVLGRQGPLAKLINSGVGLTQEYRADRKTRKESENAQLAPEATESSSSSHLEPPHSDVEWESEDDEAWAQDLDSAQAEYMVQHQKTEIDNPNETVEDIADNFLRTHAPPPYGQSGGGNAGAGPLENPVILPQRRPGMRARGFVRAYAPALAARGVTQDAWLDFLNNFDKAVSKNKLFHVLQLAIWIADKISLAVQGVSLIVRAVSMFLHLTFEMSRRGYIHAKQNKFLDKINDSYFKPRGLYALIIKYKPKKEKNPNSLSSSTTAQQENEDEEWQPISTVDIESNTTQTILDRQATEGKFWKGLMKGTAGKTTHEAELPDFAPLTFPYLDTLSEADKQSSIKRQGAFLADYYDRRAQATFASENPDSKLSNVAPRKEFASSYSDPTHPQSQADLIGTLSGGKVTSFSSKVMGRRKERRGKLGIGGEQLPGERVLGKRDARKSRRPMKKLLRQDALYLLVADLPTQREMDAVREAVERLADEP